MIWEGRGGERGEEEGTYGGGDVDAGSGVIWVCGRGSVVADLEVVGAESLPGLEGVDWGCHF